MNTELTSNNCEMSNCIPREAVQSGVFFKPNVDIVELEDELLLKADMPGATADSITLDYDKGLLKFQGVVKQRQFQQQDYLAREFGVADFRREFAINQEIDATRVTAEYKNGVLTIHLPKAEESKPRRIAVKAN